MNQDYRVISENLVISQPLYDNNQACQSIYDKYLKDCAFIPISVKEQEEPKERPFVEARQGSQQQNLRNHHNIQEYNSLEPELRNIRMPQVQQQRQQHIHYHGNPYQQRVPQYQHYHNYRAQQEYYDQHVRRLEQARRRKQNLPKYGLDQGEIEALSEINYRRSRASCWDEENKKCSICITHFEEDEKIRFLPCLHRFHSQCIDSWLASKGSCPLCKKYVRCLVQQFQ